MLSAGSPIRHHIVAYMYAKLCSPHSANALNSQLRLLPAEVGAATWLTPEMIKTIAAVSDAPASDGESNNAVAETTSSNSFPSTIE
jgi:hypothetical protein